MKRQDRKDREDERRGELDRGGHKYGQSQKDRRDERRGMEDRDDRKYHQSEKDRRDERLGMDRYERDSRRHNKSSSIYKNEVSKPEQPKMHELSPKDMGWKWVGDGDEAAYGACGEKGCKEDRRKIDSQFKNYGWD